MSYAEFFKVRSFKWSRSVHTLDAYTYIKTSTCYPHLYFLLFCILKSVIYAFIALIVTMLPGIADF